MSILKSFSSVLLIFAFQQIASAKEATAIHTLSTLERVVVFAVQQAVKAGNLQSKRGLCIGIGQGLGVDDKAIISELKRSRLRVHENDWCNPGPRGVMIAIVAPIIETSTGTYELILQVDDLTIQPGEHFATLVKRGTYVIRCEGKSEPQLISYRESCCSKTN